MQPARVALLGATKEFRAANDKANASLVDALIAFVEAEQARRTNAIGEAHVAASRAWAAAHRAGHDTLAKEVERFEARLDAPVAANAGTKVDSAGVSDLLRSPHHIVVDGHGGNVFSAGKLVVDLAARPLLVDFLSSLANAEMISSRALASEIFRVRSVTAKHEAQLRASFTLIKKLAKGRLGDFHFEDRSFRWTPKRPVIVLVPLAPILEARIESLLSRGVAHTPRALAKKLGASISSTKQALFALAERGVAHTSSSENQRSRKRSELKWKTRSAGLGLDQVQLF